MKFLSALTVQLVLLPSLIVASLPTPVFAQQSAQAVGVALVTPGAVPFKGSDSGALKALPSQWRIRVLLAPALLALERRAVRRKRRRGTRSGTET